MRRNFTLIEILVALCLCSAILIPLSVFMGFQLEQTQDQDRRNHALNLAQEKMNQVLEKPFDKIPVGLFADKLLLDRATGETLVDLRPYMAGNTLFHIQLESQYVPLQWTNFQDWEESRAVTEVKTSFLQLFVTIRWDESRTFSLLGYKGDI